MALAEKISREVEKVPGVASVRSLSRPSGEAIPDLKITEQAKTLEKGLGEGSQGLTDIKSGLSQVSSALSENAPKLKEAADSAGQLTAGTKALKEGISEPECRSEPNSARDCGRLVRRRTAEDRLVAGQGQRPAISERQREAARFVQNDRRRIQQADDGLKQMHQQARRRREGAAVAGQPLQPPGRELSRSAAR